MKFQQDLLKAADERDGWKHKLFNYPWFETDDKIFICPQGHYFIAILKVQFYMDKEKVSAHAIVPNYLKLPQVLESK